MVETLKSLEKAAEALEHQERIHDIRNALELWDRRGEIRIDVNFAGMSPRQTYECVPFEDAPELRDCLKKFFNGVIAELEEDIRKLGYQPQGE